MNTPHTANTAVNTTFIGRCHRLCAAPDGNSTCPAGSTAVRTNVTDSNGPCLQTKCLPVDNALRTLARGAYSLWRLGRSDRTGIYSGSVNPSGNASVNAQNLQAHTGCQGLGVIFECVAAAMNWTSLQDAAERVNLTLSSLSGIDAPANFNLTASRNAHGWLPTFFHKDDGSSLSRDGYTVLDTGLNAAGVLFARNFFKYDPISLFIF